MKSSNVEGVGERELHDAGFRLPLRLLHVAVHRPPRPQTRSERTYILYTISCSCLYRAGHCLDNVTMFSGQKTDYCVCVYSHLDTRALTFFVFFLVPEALLRCHVVVVAQLKMCLVPSYVCWPTTQVFFSIVSVVVAKNPSYSSDIKMSCISPAIMVKKSEFCFVFFVICFLIMSITAF